MVFEHPALCRGNREKRGIFVQIFTYFQNGVLAGSYESVTRSKITNCGSKESVKV